MAPASRLALAAALLALPVLAGCGGAASSSTGSSTPGTSPAAAPSASSGPATGSGATIAITVKGTTVTPAPSTVDVKAGDEVALVVTADRTSEVHVHVVDLEKPITAGTPATITFTPRQTGVYEVELHDPDLLLTKLAVR